MTLSHRKAFEWMLKEKDGLLNDAQRRKLAAHRQACPECQSVTDLANQLTATTPTLPANPRLTLPARSMKHLGVLKTARAIYHTLAWGAAALMLVFVLRWTVINLAPTEIIYAPQESSLAAGAPATAAEPNLAVSSSPAQGAPTGSEELWLTLGNSIWLTLYFAGLIGPLLLGLAGILLGIRQEQVIWLGLLLVVILLMVGLSFEFTGSSRGTMIIPILAILLLIPTTMLLTIHLWDTRTAWSPLTWVGVGILLLGLAAVPLGPWYTYQRNEEFNQAGFLIVTYIGLFLGALWKTQDFLGRWRWIFSLLLVISLLGAVGVYFSYTLDALGGTTGIGMGLQLLEFFYCFTGVALAARLLKTLLFSAQPLPPVRIAINSTLLALIFVSLYAMIRSEAVRSSLQEDPANGAVFLWATAWMAIAAAVSQAWKVKGRRLWAYAGLIVIFTLLLSPAMLVPQTLPYQLTERSAERLNQAILAYHAKEGEYPASLGDLVPRQLLLIPEPVTYYSRVWCYDGGSDFYRLGYYDSDHYYYGSFASVFVKIHASAGALPVTPLVCGDERRY